MPSWISASRSSARSPCYGISSISLVLREHPPSRRNLRNSLSMPNMKSREYNGLLPTGQDALFPAIPWVRPHSIVCGMETFWFLLRPETHRDRPAQPVSTIGL